VIVVGSSFRRAAALLGVAATAASGIGACTSGVTPDCSDAQCAAVVDASGTDSGDDGTAYATESGAESGPAESGLEAGETDADGGSSEAASGPDSSDSGGSTDAKNDGPKDASADG
jgi:hypothetical protein